MVAKNRKYSKQDKFLIGLLMLLDVLIVSFLVFSNIKIYSESKNTNNQYMSVVQELRSVEQRNNELKEMFTLQTQEETERFLREKGLYKKQGEEVVVIKRTTGPIHKDIVRESASFWDKLAGFFRNAFKRD